MSKFSEENDGTTIFCEYNIKSVVSRKQALKWIATVVMMKEADIHTIEMTDFLSYHDGTQTKILHKIASIPDFVNEYIKSEYIGVDISGLLDNVSFDLLINLDTQEVVLSLSAEDAPYLEKIESLLGLN